MKITVKTDPATCPCCGQGVKRDKPVIDTPASVIVYNNKIKKLQPLSADILFVLNEAYPKHVLKTHLMSRIFGQRETEYSEGTMSVAMSKLRKDIQDFDLQVISTRTDGHTGFRLVLPKLVEITPEEIKKQVAAEVAAERPVFAPEIRSKLRHGTLIAYRKFGCRCAECVVKWRESFRATRRKRQKQLDKLKEGKRKLYPENYLQDGVVVPDFVPVTDPGEEHYVPALKNGPKIKPLPNNPPKPDVRTHGVSGYARGCRCNECLGQYRAYHRRYKKYQYDTEKKNKSNVIELPMRRA